MARVTLAGLLLAGCRAQVSDAPPSIRYGEEPCAQCRMLISEARYAAARVTASGDVEKFDDIGCLLRYRTQHPSAERRLWLHDYQTAVWLAASAAACVQGPSLATPMGSGIIALTTLSAAQDIAQTTRGHLVPCDTMPSPMTVNEGG